MLWHEVIDLCRRGAASWAHSPKDAAPPFSQNARHRSVVFLLLHFGAQTVTIDVEFMAKKTYARLGKIAHTAATPLLKVYMRRQRRVRVLVLNEKDEVLLVRSWFGHQRWSLPGGGIRRTETPAVAGAREVFEETGVTIDERHVSYLGEFQNGDSSAPFIVDCQVIKIEKQPAHIAARRRLEMLDVAWFSMEHLPSRRSRTVDEALKLYKQK